MLVEHRHLRDIAGVAVAALAEDRLVALGLGFADEPIERRADRAVGVDREHRAIDTDGSVCATLDWLIGEAKAQGHEAIFCKGGDRNAGNIPEMTVLNKHGAQLIDGLGAKIDSSSRIIAGAKKPSA